MHDVTDGHMLLAGVESATTQIWTENKELACTHSPAGFYACILNQVLSKVWLVFGMISMNLCVRKVHKKRSLVSKACL